jgi:putative glutamine amidotransferase
MGARPPIGINLDYEQGEFARSCLRHTYYDAVFAAGGRPVLIPPIVDEGFVDEALAGIAALVLTGGDDLDPALYGEQRHETCRLTAERRQRFDLLLARKALERGLPILGICMGMQTLNVVAGGDLYPDIPAFFPGAIVHHSGDPQRPAHHDVRLAPETRLAAALRAERFEVNSVHHQAVRRLAAGFRAAAFAPDGVIEAIELASGGGCNGFVFAVQWHPERIAEREPHLRLFYALVEAARGHARKSIPAHDAGGGR